MHAAILLGAVIAGVLVTADWVAFRSKEARAVGYGVAVGRHHERLLVRRDQFDADGVLALPQGWARLCLDRRAIMLRPDRARAVTLRTAWPLNGAVHYAVLEEPASATLVMRTPWSSFLITALWFLTVSVGLLVYLVFYALAGGLSSASGVFMAVALCGLGLLVLIFGMLIVAAAYRLENKRLMALYGEFRDALRAEATRG